MLLVMFQVKSNSLTFSQQWPLQIIFSHSTRHSNKKRCHCSSVSALLWTEHKEAWVDKQRSQHFITQDAFQLIFNEHIQPDVYSLHQNRIFFLASPLMRFCYYTLACVCTLTLIGDQPDPSSVFQQWWQRHGEDQSHCNRLLSPLPPVPSGISSLPSMYACACTSVMSIRLFVFLHVCLSLHLLPGGPACEFVCMCV